MMLSRRYSCALAGAFLLFAPVAMAQTTPSVTVGAGLQTALFVNSPEDGDTTTKFTVPSARLYFNGTAAEHVKFMFNTEYNGVSSDVGVLDAVAIFDFNPKFQLWAGRFLPPSDRANLYGPYYSHHWAVYTDGIQDGYPFDYVGRDNGMMWWGQFNKLKLSAGAFDGESTTGNTEVLGAFRAQVDLWDAEDGYYLNGTYYGAKDLLAIGAAAQVQDGNTAWNIDFLLEKKLGGGGVVSIESQYNSYDKLGGYDGRYAASSGAYILGSYLFPKAVGKGKVELLAKYADAQFEEGLTVLDPDYEQKTTEINFNYLIKEFNARIMIFYKNTDFDAVRQNFNQFGVGIQIQM